MVAGSALGVHWKQFIAECGIENGCQFVTQFFLNPPDCLYTKKSWEFLQSYSKTKEKPNKYELFWVLSKFGEARVTKKLRTMSWMTAFFSLFRLNKQRYLPLSFVRIVRKCTTGSVVVHSIGTSRRWHVLPSKKCLLLLLPMPSNRV